MNSIPETTSNHILKQYFGYSNFRGQQEDIIKHILLGADALVLMPTGGGKSLCYQIPALQLSGITLVISPLISLMKDQVDALRANGIEAAFLNSSLSAEQEQEIASRCFHGTLKLLYMAPEKAIAMLPQFLKQLPLSLIAIDEAHCVSNWGHDFRPEYKELHTLRNHFPNTPMMALTATADKTTRADILQLLGLRNPQVFISSFDRPNLSLTVKAGLNKREKLKDIESFITSHQNQSGIIYCTSRNSTEALASDLRELGIDAKAYHAGLSSDERSKIQEAFVQDETQIICATIAFGMGIDKSNVRFVLHYNLPKSIESYYQEIGRGGRDGMPCDTILYYTLGDLMMLRSFADQSTQREMHITKLNHMQEFAEAKHCRRKILLNYFGQQQLENCNNCDVCKHPPKQTEGTVLAQKALSALTRIQQSGEQVGSQLLIDVLRGMKHSGIYERKLHLIKTYGAGADLSAREWGYYILQMIQLGVFEIAYNQGNVLLITDFGKHLLQGIGKLYLNEPEIVEYKRKSERSKNDMVHPSPEQTESLLEKLRAVRKQIAKESNLPPYIIFHDSTLQDMVAKLPHTENELLQVSGISTTKMEKYGQAFLSVLQLYPQTQSNINTDNILSEKALLCYKNELEQKHLRFSAAVVAHVLAGDTSVRYYGIGKQVSFFGVLQGIYTVDEIRKKINPIYAPIEAELKTQKKQLTESNEAKRLEKLKEVEAYFAGNPFNKWSDEKWKNTHQQFKALPFEKPTETVSEAIKALRKQYFRANEPWAEQEQLLFKEAYQASNNLARLIQVTGRSERSILAMASKIDELK